MQHYLIVVVLLFIFSWRIIASQYWLVSAIQQHEPATCIYMSPPCWASLPFPAPDSSRLLQSPDLSSLSHTANFHWLSILHMVVHISPSFSASLTLSFRPSVSISLFSISMHPLLIVVLTGSCLMTSDVEQIFLCLTRFHISSFWSVCSNLPPTFFLLNLREREKETGRWSGRKGRDMCVLNTPWYKPPPLIL